MDATLATRIEPFLGHGFGIMASLWLASSGWVVVDRVRYDRRQQRLQMVERALSDPTLESLQPLERAAAVRDLLSRLPVPVAYRLTGNQDLALWVREVCAAHSLEHIEHRCLAAAFEDAVV